MRAWKGCGSGRGWGRVNTLYKIYKKGKIHCMNFSELIKIVTNDVPPLGLERWLDH